MFKLSSRPFLTTFILVALFVSLCKAIFMNQFYACTYCSDGSHCCTLNNLNLTEETFKFDTIVPEGTTKIKVINSNIPKLGDGLCRCPVVFITPHHDITELILSEIGIIEVVTKAFYLCPNLKTLVLSDNKIKSLNKDLFDVHSKMEYINLRNNSLQTIPVELFRDLKSLGELNLSNNYFKTFDPELIKPCPALRDLKLASNDLFELNIRKILEYAPKLGGVAFNDNQLRCERAQQIKDFLEEKQIRADLHFVGTGRNRTQPTKTIETILCLDDLSWATLHFIYTMDV